MEKIEVKIWRSEDGKKLWYKSRNRRLAAQLIKHDDGENVIHLQYTRLADPKDTIEANNWFRCTNGRTTTTNLILSVEAAEVTLHALLLLLNKGEADRSTT